MAKYWHNNYTLPISCRGKHQKLSRIIDDEDIAEKCHTWIHMNGSHTTPHHFKEFAQESLLPEIGANKTIGTRTARRWLDIIINNKNKEYIMMDMREKTLLNIGKYFYQRWPSSKNIWRLMKDHINIVEVVKRSD